MKVDLNFSDHKQKRNFNALQAGAFDDVNDERSGYRVGGDSRWCAKFHPALDKEIPVNGQGGVRANPANLFKYETAVFIGSGLEGDDIDKAYELPTACNGSRYCPSEWLDDESLLHALARLSYAVHPQGLYIRHQSPISLEV
ncbi:hypothetical protein [Streptomyces sp. 8N706]|uniref:hypothetical protein n=1 Tax=Streptomyces sp. 8N706 TaxID=3457416 RepID=UPI003FD44999